MKRREVAATCALLTAAMLGLPGCGSGTNDDTHVAIDAGEPPGSHHAAIDAGHGGRCLSSRTPVSLAEVTPLGYAASDVMALLGPPRAATLRYRDVAGDGFVRLPDTAGTTIHVTAEFDPARTFFVDLAPDPDAPPPPSVPCDDYLLLGVNLTLTSDDGAFDEILDAEFITKQVPERLHAWINVAAKDMRGSFSLATTNGGGQFNYSFRQTFLHGTWLGRVDANDLNSIKKSFEGGPFADWGSAPCVAGSTPILQDGSAYATLAAQAIDTIANAPVALSFSDGTYARARVSYPPSRLACRVEDPQFLVEPEGTILLPDPITVATDDGRWTATLDATGVGHVDTGTLSSLRVYYNGTQTLAPAEFAAFYGFTGVDFTNHTKARLSFSVDYDVASQSAIGGGFNIWGVFSDASTLGSTVLDASVGGM